MNKRQIDNYFELLNENLSDVKGAVKIILTGAAAGNLMGSVRPSLDIDFAFLCDKKNFEKLDSAIKRTCELTGIPANYSEDIDRWSQITLMDYKHHTISYKKFGRVNVHILSPSYWTIGKIDRYLDIDVNDLIKVLKNRYVSPLALSQLWGKALKESPRSSELFVFKLHVEHFFKTYGGTIWEDKFSAEQCIKKFWESAGVKHKNED